MVGGTQHGGHLASTSAPRSRERASSLQYIVWASDRGNIFMREIAELVVAALRDCNREARLATDGLPEAARSVVNLVVAPHELFHLAAEHSSDEVSAAARASICINVEQPGMPWFELSFSYASLGPICLDINPTGAKALERRGLHALHLPLGYHESLDRWGGRAGRGNACQSTEDRDIDVIFLGSSTPRRESFLARCAASLSGYRSEIRLFTFDEPVSGSREGFYVGASKMDRLRRSKLMLNVHRGDEQYFEWVRVLEAMANGCVVATEASLGYEPLEPFNHFVQAPLECLDAYVAALLLDPTERRRISGAAYEFIRTELDFTSHLSARLPEIESVAPSLWRSTAPHERSAPREVILTEPDVPLATGTETVGEGARGEVAGDQIVAGSLAGEPSPEGPDLGQVISPADLSEFRASLRQAALAEIAFRRRAEHLSVASRSSRAGLEKRWHTDAWGAILPDVTVVCTAYDYESFLPQAMASVVASRGVEVELVVVDDASRDGSVEAARDFMAGNTTFPIMLIHRAVNEGTAHARNCGFAAANAPNVFVLDADNLVSPDALCKLHGALCENSEAAFSYGIIACFGRGASGLISQYPWDVLRVTREAYVDAMALFRKDAWEEAGGYDETLDERWGGWEDLDLWARMADRGYRGAFVPDFVGWHRGHGLSRDAIMAMDMREAIADLNERYPSLPWSGSLRSQVAARSGDPFPAPDAPSWRSSGEVAS